MAIVVNGPDGSSFSFPDNTPQNEMQQAMDDHYGPTPLHAKDILQGAPVPKEFSDVPKSLMSGLGEGAAGIAGTFGDIREGAANLANWGAGKFGYGLPPETMDILKGAIRQQHPAPTTQDVRAKMEMLTGPFHEPETTAGKYAKTVGEFAPAALFGPGGLGRRIATEAVLPGLFSEGAGQMFKGSDLEPYARIAGAVAAPATMFAGSKLLAPIISNISARVNPAGYAQRQVGRMVDESALTPQQIAGNVGQATAEGQPEFAVADALGNPGQRGLSTVTRAPGLGRTESVNFLEGRQDAQGRRVSNALAEGFDAPQTAARTETGLTADRALEADTNYGAARASAVPVDVTPAIQIADQYLRPGVTGVMQPATNISDNSIRSAVERARSYLTDGRSQVTSFEGAFQAKQEIDNIIHTATPAQQRVLMPMQRALDNQLAQASAPYANARNRFRQQSQAIEAVGEGRNAATRGRMEDTIPRYQAMGPEQQAAYRAGYVDPLIEQVQGGAVGVNKARPFTSDAFRTESGVIAPNSAVMNRRLGRESTMFETRTHAMGNSKTADNLADQAAMGLSPETIAHTVVNIATGNWGGIGRRMLTAGTNALTGNTAAVRAEVGRILRMNGMTSTPAQIEAVLDHARQIVAQRRNAVAVGFAAPAGVATNQQARGPQPPQLSVLANAPPWLRNVLLNSLTAGSQLPSQLQQASQ